MASDRRILYGSIAIGVLILMAGAAFYSVFLKAPADLARATAEGFREAFNVTPRVTIEETVVIEQTAPILELATVQRSLVIDEEWSHTWLGSTKVLRLRGAFTAKAGFDLRQPFSVAIQKRPLVATTSLPPPKLLSLQMDSYDVLHDEDGWWNRISNSDREQAVGRLQETARTKVLAAGLLEEARTSAVERITEIVTRNGARAEFTPAPGPHE